MPNIMAIFSSVAGFFTRRLNAAVDTVVDSATSISLRLYNALMRDTVKKKLLNNNGRYQLYRTLKARASMDGPYDYMIKLRARARSRRGWNPMTREHAEAFFADSIIRDIDRGQGIETALGKWVPAEEAVLIHAGAEASQLTGAFSSNMVMISSKEELKSMTRAVVALPAVLLVLSVVLTIGMAVYGKPSFEQIMDPNVMEDWQVIGFFVLPLFIESNVLFIVGGVIAFVIGSVSAMGRVPASPFRSAVLDWWPHFAVYRKLQSANLLMGITANLSSGVSDMGTTIRILRTHATPYMQPYISKMEERLNSGRGGYGWVLAAGPFSGQQADVLEDFQDIEGFSGYVDDIAKEVMLQTRQSVQRQARIGAFLIFLLGMAPFVWMVAATMSGMYSSMNALT